ncbi:MAG: 16S rRNA (guanine(966)-N(2))-methyltransferase RsmD [Clostridioides difficile]|nr:16S rRNA (guanine(966)-N(2))-methyltransferase RsmD [Clostridioides sp.]MBS5786487.1 16S rRNA (guanine(966)-N(2))-methyltransferase RsmD [Clostridioides difficile]
MRIISGRARGLKLNAPKNDNIRPTTDRIKESLFNMISPYILDSNVLDLFAGTGSLGIECLSRGAKECIFVDLNKESIKVLNSNIKKANFVNESEVINSDFSNALNSLKLKNRKFDIVFLDPPYYENMFIEAIKKIDDFDLLNEDSIVVVEHDSVDIFPENLGRLEKNRDKKYGNTTLTFYKLEDKNE